LPFANIVIEDLKQQFRKRFAELDANAAEIRFFQNPFDCDIGNIPTHFQMEVIELQADERIKDKYKEENID